MELLQKQEILIEQDDRSPIVSHQKGFSHDVHAICHHSGQYLAPAETNPTVRLILREQHDFPGLPRLDKAFKKAAHSRQHEHWVWSKPGIQGTTYLLSGLLVLYLAYRVQLLNDFIPGGVWWGLYWLVLIVAGVGGTGLAGYGAYLIWQRDAIFHKQAEGMPPAISDFPVACTYDIKVMETIEAELGNSVIYPNAVKSHTGCVNVTLNPLQNDLETWEAYRHQYRNQNVGHWVAAGAIATEGLGGIAFLDDNVDFDHRLVLRVPATNLEMDSETETYSPFKSAFNYNVRSQKALPQIGGLALFPLQCEPRLAPDNSRLLELHFSWLGAEPAPQLVLEECVLGRPETIPKELLSITQVVHGRYDPTPGAERVIWCNLPFQEERGKPHLRLQLQFEHPLLDCSTNIVGSYRVRVNGLVSDLEINEKHIWTAWGLKAKPEDSRIQNQTMISGSLIIDPQRLGQEHEHVSKVSPLTCNLPPNEKTVSRLMHILLDEGFDLQNIVQAPPQMHPAGRLDAQLRYWDISGRHYDRETLEAIDLHIVVSGYERISRISSKEYLEPRTQIDIRLRCLHDPRQRKTAEHADTLLGVVNLVKVAQQPLTVSLPYQVYSRLRNILLNTGVFTQSREIQAIFRNDNRLSAWEDSLPQSGTPAERVEATIQLLFQKQNDAGENGLALLLAVLQEQTDPQSMQYQHFHDLRQQLAELQTSFDSTTAVPPGDTFAAGLITRMKQTLHDLEVNG